jgi:D-threonate/D-erythronate kinase
MTDCAIIADDLTGACDAAVHFAAAGLRTVVPLDGERGEARVVAFSTESRDIDAVEIPCRLRQIAGRVRALEPRIIFKKIDSTLRGNTAVELIAAADAFECDAVVVNPAFPGMGRIVEAGRLRVTTDAAFAPVEIAAWLRAKGASACCHVPAGAIAAAIEGGARFVTVDATSAEHLGGIAVELLGLSKRVLWAGSAGLARALAAAIADPEQRALPPPTRGPVLFCIGSDHPVTVEQQRRLTAGRGAMLLDALATTADELSAALRRHVILRIPRGQIEPPSLALLVSKCRPGAFLLSGGDTASLVCRALGARAIELQREFAPGVPLGILQAGSFPGLPVVTKSGGFGAPDDLLQIADYFYA